LIRKGKEERMSKHLSVLILLACMMLVSGCVSAAGGIAPSTIPVGKGEYSEIGDASGSSWGVIFLGIPLSEAGPSTALRRAKESSGADGLVEVTVVNRVFNLFLFSITQTQVEGTAIKTR
jgi:hypothetical protein